MTEHTDGNFTGEAHPESVFMKYIWDKKYSMKKVEGVPRLRTSNWW
jgi:hypothetical protein